MKEEYLKQLEHYNPWMGATTYGNLLDLFDNPSYNIKLYMVRDTKLFANAREDGTAIDPTVVDKKKDIVVLAQTGVTGTQVDNIAIETFAGGTYNTTKVTFSVIQPGAASFLDQIMIAKAYLGMPQSVTTPLVMDIRFQGYDAGGDENSPEGGEWKVIDGPYRWILTLTELSIEIDENGSRYEMVAYPLNQKGLVNNTIYSMPLDIVTGTSKPKEKATITSHVQDLEKKLNSHFKETAELPYTIKFDLSELLGPGTGDSTDYISDETLYSSSDFGTDKMNRIISELQEVLSSDEHRGKVADIDKYTGVSPEKEFGKDAISFKKGTTIDQFFTVLLSMNAEMYKKVTRKKDPFNEESEIDKNQAYTYWFKVHTETQLGKYNRDLTDFEQTFIYKPRLYKTSSTNAAYDPKEVEVDTEAAEARAKQIVAAKNFNKHYEYIFTGRNTDVLALDLKYDMGIALLASPRKGRIGSALVTSANVMASEAKAESDLTQSGVNNQVEQSEKEQTKKKALSLLDKVNKLKDEFDDALNTGINQAVTDIINTVAGALGVPADRLQSLVASGNQEGLTGLIDSAGDDAVRRIAGSLENAIGEPVVATEGPELNDYSPQASGFTYAADFIGNEEDSLTPEQLVDMGYVSVETAKEAMTQGREKAGTKSGSNRVESATIMAGDPRNTLFGNYADQLASDQAFLAMLDLGLRGDPWYLGSGGLTPKSKQSSKTTANLENDTQSFWLTIRAPQTYDFDVVDEDNNSGYWRFDGVSQTFSGLYNVMKVTHNFSDGAYTIDMEAYRHPLGPDKLEAKGTKDNDSKKQPAVGDSAVSDAVASGDIAQIRKEQENFIKDLKAKGQETDVTPPTDSDINFLSDGY